MIVSAVPQSPNPADRMTLPDLISATASSADLYSFEPPLAGLGGGCAAWASCRRRTVVLKGCCADVKDNDFRERGKAFVLGESLRLAVPARSSFGTDTRSLRDAILMMGGDCQTTMGRKDVKVFNEKLGVLLPKTLDAIVDRQFSSPISRRLSSGSPRASHTPASPEPSKIETFSSWIPMCFIPTFAIIRSQSREARSAIRPACTAVWL